MLRRIEAVFEVFSDDFELLIITSHMDVVVLIHFGITSVLLDKSTIRGVVMRISSLGIVPVKATSNTRVSKTTAKC